MSEGDTASKRAAYLSPLLTGRRIAYARLRDHPNVELAGLSIGEVSAHGKHLCSANSLMAAICAPTWGCKAVGITIALTNVGKNQRLTRLSSCVPMDTFWSASTPTR